MAIENSTHLILAQFFNRSTFLFSGRQIGVLLCLSISVGFNWNFTSLQAQSSPPRFKKFQMGNSACFLHFPLETLEVYSDTLDDAIQYYTSGRLDKHIFQAEIIRLHQPLFAPEIELTLEDSIPEALPVIDPIDSLVLLWKVNWLNKYRLISNGEWIPAKHPSIPEAHGWQETWSSEDGKTEAIVQIWAHPAALVFLMVSGRTSYEDEIVKGIFFRNIILPKVYRE
jgi:hypothetical protein